MWKSSQTASHRESLETVIINRTTGVMWDTFCDHEYALFTVTMILASTYGVNNL